jgi:hypothetical protein
VNINIEYDKRNFILLHLLVYYVSVNPKYASTNFGKSFISVLESFRKIIFLSICNSLKEKTTSHHLNHGVLQTALGTNVGPQDLK